MSDRYTYRVAWSEEDGEYVGTCAELPGLSHLDPDQAVTLAGIRDLVAGVIEDIREDGGVVPEPLSSKTYSGKFLTRVPPSLHSRLALEAQEAGVSLNQMVAYRLALVVPDTAARPVRAKQRQHA